MSVSRSSKGFATLSVLMLALALLILIIGLSRFLAGFRSEVRVVEEKQRARIGVSDTNRPPVLRPAVE
jgi:cell division protein FtsN